MWIILVLLWLAPVSIALVLAARVLGGLPAVSDDEWRALFRDRKDFKLSIWMALTFTLFTVMFFFIGIFEGLVLMNINSYWLVLVPLLTGLVALLLVLLWLRTGARETRTRRPIPCRTGHRRARYAVAVSL